jgi:hypothetical protein
MTTTLRLLGALAAKAPPNLADEIAKRARVIDTAGVKAEQ